MALEIIQPGTIPSCSYTGTCTNCGCKVRAKKEDHTAEWPPSNHKNSKIQVDCPTEGCGYKIPCKRDK